MHRYNRFLFFLFVIAITVPPVLGEEEEESYLTPNEDPESYEVDEVLKPYESEFFDFLDTPHEIISQGVEAAAQGMDLFFADEKIYREATNSYARLTTNINFSHGGESNISEDIKIKVDLKETKKKLKLLLKSDTDRELQTGNEQNTASSQSKETTNFYAALQKEISRRNKWHTKASLGIKLKVPLDPFFLVRANKNAKYGDWRMRFSETLFWFNSRGTGASTTLEFDYALANGLLFRSRTSELWTDFKDYHEVDQSFSLFHEITERRAVHYVIGSQGISQPVWHNTNHYAGLNYRQRVHRDWLFIEINPIYTFARANGYKDERQLIIRMEMVFGNKYIYPQSDSSFD